MKINVLAICGGNGVICWPFKKYLIANVEPRSAFKTPNDIQWKLNFGDIPLFRDYKLSRFKDVQIDVIIGAPTCGHSSQLALSRAKKFGDGSKDETIDLFINAVKVLKPKFFFFENLPNLYSSFSEADLTKAFEGYRLIKYCTSVASFGNSQINRKRLVIIGTRTDIKINTSRAFRLFNKENLHLKTVKELETALSKPRADLFHIREADSLVITMERDFKKLNLKQIRDIWNDPKTGDRKSWDATTTGKGRMKTLPGVYRNRANEFPRTVLKNHRQFNTKGYIMSPRELAIVQGIPNDFKLYYDPTDLTYCLNKARVTVTKTPPMQLQQWAKIKIIKAIRKIQTKC